MNKKHEPYPFKRVHTSSSTSTSKHRFRFSALRTRRINIEKLSFPQLKALGKQCCSPQLLLWFLVGFVSARASILGELTPFVFALLTAFGYAKPGRAVALWAAASIGLWTQFSGPALVQNWLALFILTIVVIRIRCQEKYRYFFLPILTGSVVFVAKSLAAFLVGINYYQEMIIVFDALCAALLTPAFLFCQASLQQRKPLSERTYEELAAGLFVITILLLGLSDLKIYGLHLSSVLCRYAILIAASIWGSGGGTIMGVIAGIIPSLSSSLFAPALGMYAISGLLAGLLRGIGRLGCILGFLLGMLALYFYFLPAELTLIKLSETLIACCLFFASAGIIQKKIPRYGMEPLSTENFSTYAPEAKSFAQNRIHHLSQVFAEIGASFALTPVKTEEKNLAYINYLYDTLSQELCQNCIHHSSCWIKDGYHTSQELLQLFTLAEKKGHLSLGDCPMNLQKKCVRKAELIHTVNHLYDTIRLHEYWNQKLGSSRELLAKQLNGISEMVKNIAHGIDFTQQIDYALKDDLMQKALSAGYNVKEIIPFTNGGQLHIQISVPAGGYTGTCEFDWSTLISQWVGYPMTVLSRNQPPHNHGFYTFTLQKACFYKVESGHAQIAKDEICGDSFHLAELPDGKMVAVLSDGMGFGPPAKKQSQTAIRLLDTMLSGGFDKEITLETINSVLLLRSKEDSFTTMDMVVIDLFTAEADIIKTAAAPSFYKRSRHVEVVTSSSLPVGILPKLDLHHEKISLMPGDIVVLVSDGVLEVAGPIAGETWMANLLSQIDETDCQALADHILTQALALAKGKVQDDMTALCLRITLP